MKFETTQEDILSSKILKPGWYIAELKDYTEKQAKGGDSEVTEFKFIITSGPNLANGTPAIGVPVRFWISEKFMGEAAITFLNVTAGKNPDYDKPVEVNMPNARGKKYKLNIENGSYQNKPTNVIARFGALDSKVAA